MGAELQLTFDKGGLEKLGFSIQESFSIYGLKVSTAGGLPISFNWNREQDQFECSGGLQFEFSGNTILVNFSNQGAPGIVISDGHLTTLNGYVAGSITIAGATLSTQGISVQYGNGQWEVYGDLTLQVRSERSGKGKGRIYTITVEAADVDGNKSRKTTMVTVPK